MEKIKSIKGIVQSIFKNTFLFLGAVFFCMILLSFTDYPYWAYYKLGMKESCLNEDPDLIMVYGAGGMPDSETLMRLYFAANAAHLFPNAKIVLAMPVDSIEDENNALYKMMDELRMHKVRKKRILFEYEGANTYQQSCNVFNRDDVDSNTVVLVITSPDHMYRAVKTFKKLGVKNVGGMPSFESAIAEKLLHCKKKELPDSDKELQFLDLRYNFWSYMKYQITVAREYCAIGYYRLRGWI